MKLFWLMGPTEAGGGASAAAMGFCEVQGRRQMLLGFPSSGFSPGDLRRAGGGGGALTGTGTAGTAPSRLARGFSYINSELLPAEMEGAGARTSQWS